MNHADEEFKKFKEMERTGVSRFPISLDRYRTQWYALNNLDAALKPGGRFVFSGFGQENLHQVKILTGSGLEYLPVEELRRLLYNHFTYVDLHREMIRQTFAAPFDVLRHLQQTGVTATGQFRWTPGSLRTFERDYTERYSADGQVFLDWDVLYGIVQK